MAFQLIKRALGEAVRAPVSWLRLCVQLRYGLVVLTLLVLALLAAGGWGRTPTGRARRSVTAAT
jgi:hypothetical protein